MSFSKSNIARVSQLVELALKGLANLYDEELMLFTFYIKDGQKIPMPISWSICYTAITLLGLNKIQGKGFQEWMTIDQQKALQSLVSNWKRTDTFGHLGLIQWANAECKGQYSHDLTKAIARNSSTEKLMQLPTTELAWLLTGICESYKNLQSDDLLKELAFHYYTALTNNYNPETGLYSHTTTKAGALDFRSKIGNFADQIYSVYALSTFYEVFNNKQAIAQAVKCAECLCALQGEQGQWWWHYHSSRGGVGSPYPVYSVHQDGMGPMSLLKLSMVSGKDFHLPIIKGINWLFSSNELGVEMIDWNQNLIWRDIELSSLQSITRYISIFLIETGLTRPMRRMKSKNIPRLNREMRPYELGWLLYAFADLFEKQ